MARKLIVCLLILFEFVALNLASPRLVVSSPAAERLNIIFLLADDLRGDALGSMGNRIIQTPHLDALARRGTLFENSFVTTSICAVSRASILAGQYARRHGINDFQATFSPAAFAETYPALLRAAGYRIGFIGKYGVGTAMPETAFDYWRGFPGQGRFFTPGDPVHLTRKMGDQALEFLQASKPEQPFCLSVSFKAPHAQDNAPREFPPDPQDEALYRTVEIPRPKTAREEFYEALPPAARNSEGRTRWLRRFNTPEKFQQTARDYYRLITGVDREVGRLVAALRAQGLSERTLIVFTSDNGFFLGERGMADKWLMYEESIRTPLIIFDPGLAKKRQGQRLKPMALNIDLAPTLLDYAGLKVPTMMQGRSLRPLIYGQAKGWRTEWFYEHLTLPKIIPPSEGVRTDRWKYLRWLETEPVIEELYDLKADPREERNLASQPAHRKTLEQLRDRWARLRQELE